MTETPAVGGLAVVRPTPILCAPRSSQGLTLMSDLHLGSSQVDYALIEKELKAAKRNGDRVLLGGDVFDLILPGDLKRYEPAKVHARIRGRNDPVNAAVEWAAELLGPYADLIDMVGLGNHETAAQKKGGVDAVRLLVKELNAVRKPDLRPVAQPGYTAYLDYRLQSSPESRPCARYVVFYTHGAGKIGSAVASLKKLQCLTSAFAADLYWSGHSHARAHCTEVMIHAGRTGRPVAKDVKIVVTGSYMVAYGAQSPASLSRNGPKGNYASEAALAPHGLGGARVVLRFDKAGFPSRVEVIQ
jgi:hypothetical protein